MDQDDGPEPPAFAATGKVAGEHLTVLVTGEVDMSTADEMFAYATRDGCRTLTLDLQGVGFFDSAGIHALVRLARRYPAGFDVIASAPVRRVLDIAGLGEQRWLRSP